MENCLYRGKTICTFDLKDENGFYYEDMVLEWKEAAADRRLTCTECSAPVYLAAGPIKEPYFAHYDLEECDYGYGHESEELKKGKRLLYQLLKRSFPSSEIFVRSKMENGMYSTLFCVTEEGKSIAVDFRLQNNSLEKFRLRDTFYQSNRITPIYILGIRQDKDTKQIDWYQSLIQSSMGYLAFLDAGEESLTLKKSFGYRLGKDRKFAYCNKTYAIKELLLNSDGQMICDFTEECYRLERMLQEEKENYRRTQERNRVLKDHYLEMEAREQERMEQYLQRVKQDEQMEHNDKSILQGLDPAILEKCRKMIEEGNGHLVSKKYYDAIMVNHHYN
jgi:competence protein CoiA